MKPSVQPGVAEPEALLWQPVVAVPQAGKTEEVRPGEAFPDRESVFQRVRIKA
jgi:hypothetical protein